MKKIIKEVVRFLVRLLFVFMIIIAPFILCAIAYENKIFATIVIIISIILVFREITK